MYKKHMLKCSALVLALILIVQAGVLPVRASEKAETGETEEVFQEEGTEEVFQEEGTEEVFPEETEEVFPEGTEEKMVQEPSTEGGMPAEDSAEFSAEKILEEETIAAADDTAAAEKLKEELSRNGNEVTQYVNDEDQKIKTTVWVKGVTPPDISEFTKDQSSVGDAKYVTYKMPYQTDKGWYDVNKTVGRVEDGMLCYAAGASNAIHWWLEQNETYIDQYLVQYPDDPRKQDLRTLRDSFVSQSDSAIYKRFIRQFSSRKDGFWSDILVDQFVNGYVPNENGATNYSDVARERLVQNGPSEKGGFFYDIFGTTLLTNRMSSGSFQTFGNDLKANVMEGNLVLIDYGSGSLNHVVTIWGVEYDTDGQISAVYLADSDDEREPYAMVRYMVKNVNGNPVLSTNINGNQGSRIAYMQTVSLGQQIWEKRLNADPNAPKIQLDLEWGNTEFSYNGSAHLPYVREVKNIEGEDDVLVFVEGAQTNAGVHTANVVIKGASAGRYELPDGGKKEFVIQKAIPKVKLTAKLDQNKTAVSIEIRVTGTNNEKPTGTVTIKNGQDVIADQVLLTNGAAAYTWTNLPLGNHRITAEFEPSADGVGKNYEKANSNSAWIDLPKKEQSALSILPVGDKKYGDGEFLLATTGGSGKGAVTYSCSTDDVISISGDTAVIVGAGTTTLTAVKAGDDTYNSTSATYTITVAKADAPQITYPSAGSLVHGQTLAQSVLSGGSREYGSFVWDNGEQIPEAGNSSYTVRFIPDSATLKNYETITQVTKTVPVAVRQANPAVTLKAGVKSGGKQAELSAFVGKVPQGADVTGTVTFVAIKDDGSVLTEIAGAVPVINGTATYVWSGMSLQAYQVQARYGGDKNYKGVSSQTVQLELGSGRQENDSSQNEGENQRPNQGNGDGEWVEENGGRYWYENGVKQGLEGRGKEIYDPVSDAWYWLDSIDGGRMAAGKDVYQTSLAGEWGDSVNAAGEKTGKWVRYDNNGHMVKGWQTTSAGTYYFDGTYGTMAKGDTVIDGKPCAFDRTTGIGINRQWCVIDGVNYWYENGVRQGLDGRGKEIYDPASDAWYWLDAIENGKMAAGKDVYQDSNGGKWVRYDGNGRMVKGWNEQSSNRYYFDPVTGAMAKGWVEIDGASYYFDEITGVCQDESRKSYGLGVAYHMENEVRSYMASSGINDADIYGSTAMEREPNFTAPYERCSGAGVAEESSCDAQSNALCRRT